MLIGLGFVCLAPSVSRPTWLLAVGGWTGGEGRGRGRWAVGAEGGGEKSSSPVWLGSSPWECMSMGVGQLLSICDPL